MSEAALHRLAREAGILIDWEDANGQPRTVSPDTLAAEALAIMNDFKIGALFAVDDAGRPVGILHVHDCLRAGVT